QPPRGRLRRRGLPLGAFRPHRLGGIGDRRVFLGEHKGLPLHFAGGTIPRALQGFGFSHMSPPPTSYNPLLWGPPCLAPSAFSSVEPQESLLATCRQTRRVRSGASGTRPTARRSLLAPQSRRTPRG